MQTLPGTSDDKHSLTVDAYVYSNQFERGMADELAAYSCSLDMVADRIESQHQLRILTKIEHSHLIKSQLAYKLGKVFNLSEESAKIVAGCLLIEGSLRAKNIVSRIEPINTFLQEAGYRQSVMSLQSRYLPWHVTENLIEFIQHGINSELLRDKTLYYICQLIVFTYTPRDPSEVPNSLIVTPENYFNLSNMWACRPELYDTNLALSASGKKILLKQSNQPSLGFRKDLGCLAELHLNFADQIWQKLQPIRNFI